MAKPRRRMEGRTDYRQRLALLKSRKTRAVVRRTLNNIHIQFVQYERSGDRVVSETLSKHVRKYGWKFHGGSLPSAYLAGLLAGLRARKAGVGESVLDGGLQTSVKGNAIYAAALGIKHSGISIPLGNMASYERISGKHIAEYARKLKAEDKKEYAKRFSSYIKNSVDAEKMPENFEEVRKKLAGEFGVELPAGKEKITDESSEE